MQPKKMIVAGQSYQIELDRARDGWFGVVFSNEPGIVAMGPTAQSALAYARDNLLWIKRGKLLAPRYPSRTTGWRK